MKELVSFALVGLSLLSLHTSASAAPGTPSCTSSEPIRVAQGTAVSDDGDAGVHAEHRAVATANTHCEVTGAGSAFFIEIDTRESGVVGTSTVRFYCSASC